MPSVLLYAGLLLALVGLAGTFVRWRRYLPVLGGGLLLGAVAFLLPVRERQIASVEARIDEFVPAYEFSERHAIRIRASCAASYRALKAVTAPEISFFRLLTWIRRLGRPGPESILNAPDRLPLLEVATRSGFLWLADDPGRELVVGTVVRKPPGAGQPADAAAFRALSGPGFAVAAMNFRLLPDPEAEGPGCRVTTETRVHATDAGARRAFARYWRVIYPGSALIRRMWLRAVRKRAEQGPAPAGLPG